MTLQIVSESSSETELIGERLAAELVPGDTLELKGDVGCGKTTFVRGLVRGLGSSDHVSSPTFTVTKEYDTPVGKVLHGDFYRLNDPMYVKEALEEAVQEGAFITIIEWADTVKDVLPASAFTVNFERVATSETARKITIFAPRTIRTGELVE